MATKEKLLRSCKLSSYFLIVDTKFKQHPSETARKEPLHLRVWTLRICWAANILAVLDKAFRLHPKMEVL